MKQPEAKLKQKLVTGFQSVFGKSGWYTYLTSRGGQKSGIPDLVFAGMGRCAWVEAKVEPYDLSKLQAHVMPLMGAAGVRIILLKEDEAKSVSVSTIDARGVRPIYSVAYDAFKSPHFWQVVFGTPARTPADRNQA